MTLSRQSVEILLDLIEIKVSVIQIQDRDDARELNKLRKCRQELLSEKNKLSPKSTKKPLDSTIFQEKPSRKASYSGH